MQIAKSKVTVLLELPLWDMVSPGLVTSQRDLDMTVCLVSMRHARLLCLSRSFPWMSLVMATFQGDLGVGGPLLPVWVSHNFISVHLPYVYVYLSLGTEQQNPELPSWRPQFHLPLMSHCPSCSLTCFSMWQTERKVISIRVRFRGIRMPTPTHLLTVFQVSIEILALTSHRLCL